MFSRDYPFVWWAIARTFSPFIRNVEGAENLPKGGSFIAVANHASYLDDFIAPCTIMTLTKKRFNIFINSRYWRNPIFRAFFEYYRCIPVDVEKDVPSRKKRKTTNEKAFRLAAAWLKKGMPFFIFPEGSRSPDGRLRQGKHGAARLALIARVPVVPMGVVGSYDIWPKGKMLPRPGRATIRIGNPMDFSAYYGKNISKRVLEEMTAKIMAEIGKLSGQRYAP